VTPDHNDKFDLFFLFNLLQSKATSTSYKHWFHDGTTSWLSQLFSQRPDMAVIHGRYTFRYRLSDCNAGFWWCERKSEWTTNHSEIQFFPTPKQMLDLDFFSEFKHDLPQDSILVESYKGM
jgi:hypothetical protein